MNPQPQERATAVDTEAARLKRCEALLASSDDAWLIELGPVLGDRFRTFSVERVSDFEAAAAEHPRAVAIVDVDSLQDVRALIARLEQQHPELLIVVIARQPGAWSAAVSRGTVFAAIAREEMGGSSMSEALAKAEARLRRPAQEAAPARGAGPALPAAAHGTLRVLILAAAALALCAGLAIWLLHRPGRSPAALATSGSAGTTGPSVARPAPTVSTAAGTARSPAPAAVPVTANASGSVLDLLSAARVAFEHGQLLPGPTPSGTSALELYEQVLALAPGNAEAVDGVHRLFRVALAQVQADVAAGRLSDASRLLASFKPAEVDAQALRSAEASVAAARPKWLVAGVKQSIAAGDLQGAEQQFSQLAAAGVGPATIASLKAAIAASQRQLQLKQLASAVDAAISAGALLEPARDNARTRLQAMERVSSTDPQTLAAARALQRALLARAAQALNGVQPEGARPYLAAADALGPTSESAHLASQLQQALALAARRAAAKAEAARQKLAAEDAARSAAPAGRSAGPADATRGAPAAAPSYIAARPLQPLQVSYPPRALAEGLQGTVVVQFWLQPDGTAADARVVAAAPAGLFDQAAIDAVLQGRYATSAPPGGAPRLARIKIVFKPN